MLCRVTCTAVASTADLQSSLTVDVSEAEAPPRKQLQQQAAALLDMQANAAA
jgi:hypothetical protein